MFDFGFFEPVGPEHDLGVPVDEHLGSDGLEELQTGSYPANALRETPIEEGLGGLLQRGFPEGPEPVLCGFHEIAAGDGVQVLDSVDQDEADKAGIERLVRLDHSHVEIVIGHVDLEIGVDRLEGRRIDLEQIIGANIPRI